MGSTRLPGKVMLDLAGKTVLERVIDRLNRVISPVSLIVATSLNDKDDPIVDLANSLGVPYFRGSEHDVLSRYYYAAMDFGAESIIRCNADCPLIDPLVVDKVISFYLENVENYDYVSNILYPTYPTGMHCEAFSFDSLRQAHINSIDSLEREHVTPYIYRRPERFRLFNIARNGDLSHLRWTLDVKDDYIFISKIYDVLYKDNPHFGMDSVLKLLSIHPDWSSINGYISKRSTV
jgi:spore coat polysaccharide biosynthesis protein SpsF